MLEVLIKNVVSVDGLVESGDSTIQRNFRCQFSLLRKYGGVIFI